MVPKNLPMGIKIVIPLKYWHLVGMSRWENLCVPELVFGLIPFYVILLLGQFCLGIKIFEWCIDPNGIENKNTIKYPYPTGREKCETLVLDTQWHQKRRYQSNTGANLPRVNSHYLILENAQGEISKRCLNAVVEGRTYKERSWK